ncbi:SRR1-like protein [Stomoxys calcitrans]|uniref:SRR1-like domain-containing protein n=1 Tax=Stomoxys calcitrans TaxID=35570 RepID=A0A1I8PEQ8_STOCA|nr:SRR1-like protein [Stomoxys calcitrans]
MSEEFNPVTRKKWISYNSLSKKSNKPKTPEKTLEKADPPVDVDKFLMRLDVLRDRMEECEYFTEAMATLKESFLKLQYGEVIGTKIVPNRLVCFGLGQFTRNYQALHQLAFVLCTLEFLDIDEAIFFDPAFSKSEIEALEKLSCKVMKENCEGKFKADVYTIFYMPHCPNCLTNNLLWKNWSPELLKHVILINNSFESLSCSKPDRLLRLDANYIMDIMYDGGVEMPLEDDYTVQNVFNDLSVHVFPPSHLSKKPEFWANKQEPKYNETDTGDMISAEEFAKLSIA